MTAIVPSSRIPTTLVPTKHVPKKESTKALASTNMNRGSRIPDALKVIFVDAWKGKEVFAPQNGVAFKTFERALPKHKGTGNGRKKKSKQNAMVRRSSSAMHLADIRYQEDISSGSMTRMNQLSAELDLSIDVPTSRPLSSPYPSQRSPQVFLDVMLRTRGYSTETFKTLETSYYNAPTELQTSSYHGRLQTLLYSQNVSELEAVLSCGISTNPCNSHGESLLHTASRYGYKSCFRIMLECGASVQVSDDSGRTPLHSAFFGTRASYETVDLILQQDRHLLHLRDHLGSTPLSYIPRNQWGRWIDFFYSKRDEFWPRRNKRVHGVAPSGPKMTEKPHSKPMRNPLNALSTEMASMVVSGRLSPDEATLLAMCSADDEHAEEIKEHEMTLAHNLGLFRETWDELPTRPHRDDTLHTFAII